MPATARIPAVGTPTEINTIAVCLVAPNIIRITLKDEPNEVGGFFDTGVTQAEPIDTVWRSKTHPVLGTSQLAWVMGKSKEALRFQDRRPTAYVSRAPGKVPANWSILGRNDVTIQAIHYENEIDEQGFFTGDRGGAGSTTIDMSNSWLHHFYLKLSANVASGQTYRIRPPAAWNYEDIAFSFNDRETRCSALHVSFAGHRPADTGKVGYLSAWVPGEANEGAISYAGFSSFEVIDEAGATVWTGSIPSPITPTTAEPRNLFPSTSPGGVNRTKRRYGSAMPSSRLTVVSITPGTPGVITLAAGQGTLIANDEILITGQLPGVDLAHSNYITVKNKSGDTFEVYDDADVPAPRAITGAYTPDLFVGGDNRNIFKTHVANASLTNVYQLNFSAFTAGNGVYRLRVPGLGVSDPFPIRQNAWHKAAAAFAKGEYNQRHGCALDGRFGFTRQVMLRNGQDGVVIKRSKFPIVFSDQGGLIAQRIPLTYALRSSWINGATEIDAGGEWIDAGDWDVFPRLHLPSAYLMLQAYNAIPAAGRVTDWNTPLSTEAHLHLGGTHNHAELDTAPEILHMVHYALYWLLRCQESDGRVPGGIQGHNEANIYLPAMGVLFEASSHALTPQYTYAPDHVTNYVAAGMFACFGRTLIEGGWTVLGNAYLDAAELAWTWAEGVFRTIARVESATSTTIGTGSKTFTVLYNSGAPFVVGDTVRVESRANPANWMQGAITSLGGTALNPTFTVNVASVGGSGTFSDWDMKLTSYDLFHYYGPLTDVRRSTVVTGNTTAGSATITGIASTAAIQIGDHVTGAGIPDPVRVDSKTATTITLRHLDDQVLQDGSYIGGITSPNATATASGVSITCRPYGGGWSDATYKTNIEVVQADARINRVFAAACLARATGDAVYRNHFERHYITGNFQSYDGLGRAEYLGPTFNGISGADSGVVTAIRDNIIATADLELAKSEAAQGYRTTGSGGPFGNTTMHFGVLDLFAPIAAIGMEANPAKKARFRAMLECCVATVLGANQQSKSYCVGFGPRYYKNVLHVDGWTLLSRAPDGLVPYGSAMDYRFAFNVGGGSIWSDQIHYSALNHSSLASDTNYKANQVVEPSKAMRPGSFFFDTRSIIGEMEFGMPNILNNLIMAFYLHGYDGNTET